MASQGQPGEAAPNPIPMSQEQLGVLLEEIARLDTGRVILEPGVQLGEHGIILNLNAIRSKVPDPNYTLPEMLTDLNSICEPFLNQGPDHAQYAKQFLEQANEAIMIAVRDAQALALSQQQQHMQHQPPMGSMDPSGHVHHDMRHDGSMQHGHDVVAYHHQGQVVHDAGNGEGGTWLAQVVGDEGVGEGGGMVQHVHGQVMHHQHQHVQQQNGNVMVNQSYTPQSTMMQKKPDGVGRGKEGKVGTPGGKKPDTSRPRVEGRRCEVCAVIKKAGCGTDAAHFRCLKRKKPEAALELEKKVEELGDMGEEERVTVWNPKEGRKLSGQAAPMLKNLAGWLANHPGWEAHPKGGSGKKKKEDDPNHHQLH